MSESESIQEFFENLLLEENDNSVKGECDEASSPEASLGVREIRQRRRSLLKIIQDYSRRIAELNSERDEIEFEEEHVIPLDWEVRDFLKSARDLENFEGPVGLGDRISHDFEALVLLCKSRAEKLAKNRSKPPSIQLGKSSQQSIGKCTSIASEILDDELELVKLQADAKAAKAEAEAASRCEGSES